MQMKVVTCLQPDASSSACTSVYLVVKCVLLGAEGGETAFYNVAVMSVRRRRGEDTWEGIKSYLERKVRENASGYSCLPPPILGQSSNNQWIVSITRARESRGFVPVIFIQRDRKPHDWLIGWPSCAHINTEAPLPLLQIIRQVLEKDKKSSSSNLQFFENLVTPADIKTKIKTGTPVRAAGGAYLYYALCFLTSRSEGCCVNIAPCSVNTFACGIHATPLKIRKQEAILWHVAKTQRFDFNTCWHLQADSITSDKSGRPCINSGVIYCSIWGGGTNSSDRARAPWRNRTATAAGARCTRGGPASTGSATTRTS